MPESPPPPDLSVARLPPEVVEELPQWKYEFGEVFLWKGGDPYVVYRGLTFEEVDEFNQILLHNQDLAEDLLVKRVILYPKGGFDIDDLPAASADNLLAAIKASSGMSDPKAFNTYLEQGRSYAQSIEGFGMAFISNALGIDPKAVRKMTLPVMARYIAMAEMVLGREFKFKTDQKDPKRKKAPTGAPEGVPVTRDQLAAGLTKLRSMQRRQGFSPRNLPTLGHPPVDTNVEKGSSIDFQSDNRLFEEAGFGGY
jgi:hypothetical protein